MIKISWILVIIMVTALFLAGCSKKVIRSEASSGSTLSHGAGVQVPDNSFKENTIASELTTTEETLDSQSSHVYEKESVLEGRSSAPLLPIYFDFDRSNIRADQREKLQMNNSYLGQHPDLRLRIEGNCDESGTNEYNLALGEKRAENAKKYLINLGMSASKITTTSYGEERPLLYGHDEMSWAQNRRDDFVIVK